MNVQCVHRTSETSTDVQQFILRKPTFHSWKDAIRWGHTGWVTYFCRQCLWSRPTRDTRVSNRPAQHKGSICSRCLPHRSGYHNNTQDVLSSSRHHDDDTTDWRQRVSCNSLINAACPVVNDKYMSEVLSSNDGEEMWRLLGCDARRLMVLQMVTNVSQNVSPSGFTLQMEVTRPHELWLPATRPQGVTTQTAIDMM